MAVGLALTIGGTPDDALAAGAVATVVERMGETTEWRLLLPVGVTEADLPMLADPRFDPGREVALYAEVNGTVQCLASGPVRGQRIRVVLGGAGSEIEVIGGDAGLPMDREAKVAQWVDVTDADVVRSIVDGYGMAADVADTATQHTEDRRSLLQRGTDLSLVRMLARRNGMLFWLSADATGAPTAHFRAPDLDAAPQAVLSVTPPGALLDAVEIAWDVEAPNAVAAQQQDALTGEVFDGGLEASPLTPLGAQPLAALAAARRSAFLSAPSEDAAGLTARAAGAVIEGGWFLRARASADKARIGTLLRPPGIVELQGLGTRHSGRYLVTAVTHHMGHDGHRMDIEMLRNAWGAA